MEGEENQIQLNIRPTETQPGLCRLEMSKLVQLLSLDISLGCNPRAYSRGILNINATISRKVETRHRRYRHVLPGLFTWEMTMYTVHYSSSIEFEWKGPFTKIRCWRANDVCRLRFTEVVARWWIFTESHADTWVFTSVLRLMVQK